MPESPETTRWSEAREVGLAVTVILVSAAALQVTGWLAGRLVGSAPVVVTIHIENGVSNGR